MAEQSEQEFQEEVGTALEYLSTFLKLDASKILSLAEAFNSHGASVSYIKVSELTGLEHGLDAINTRDSLVSVLHLYNKHREAFEKAVEKSNIDKQLINKLLVFRDHLNKRALDGSELLYSRIVHDQRPTLTNIEDKLLITETLCQNFS